MIGCAGMGSGVLKLDSYRYLHWIRRFGAVWIGWKRKGNWEVVVHSQLVVSRWYQQYYKNSKQ